MNIIIRASRFAGECHRGQVRKYTGAPYIYHPMRVAGRVMLQSRAGEDMTCAAWLHDVMEDCGVTSAVLEKTFNRNVSNYVWALTNRSKQHGLLNREQRKEMDRLRIRECGDSVKLIKLIDRIDNLREIDPKDDFAKVYAAESRLLANEALIGVDHDLHRELLAACDALDGGC